VHPTGARGARGLIRLPFWPTREVGGHGQALFDSTAGNQACEVVVQNAASLVADGLVAIWCKLMLRSQAK
jgi:hypothetical protein